MIALALGFSLTSVADSLKVKKLSGSAKYDGHAIKAGDEVPAGGLLEVGAEPDAYVDLLFSEGHHMRLKKGAKLKINGEKTASPTRFELIIGQLFGYFVPGKNAEKIKIETKAAVAGVRGTKYLIEEDEKKGTYICVCEGVVAVNATDKRTDFPAKVKAGQDLWAKLGGYEKPGQTLGRVTTSPAMSKMTTAEFTAMGY